MSKESKPMPTTYQTCGSAIEKVGPVGTRPIAFCSDRNTAEILTESLMLLRRIHAFGQQSGSFDIVELLKRAGLI